MNRKHKNVFSCGLAVFVLTGCVSSLKNTRTASPVDAAASRIERPRPAARHPFQGLDVPEGFWVWGGVMAAVVVLAVTMRPRSGEMPHEG